MSSQTLEPQRPSPNSDRGMWEECYSQVAAQDPGAIGLGPLKLPPSLERVRENWELRTHIAATAAVVGLPQRTLAARFFLHVPRFLGDAELSGLDLSQQLSTLACGWGRQVEAFSYMLRPPDEPVTSARQLEFGPISPEVAQIIHEKFHYIGSHRPGGESYGLTLPDGRTDRLAALVTISPCDLNFLGPHLPEGVSIDQVRVASRIFAFDWTPKNTLSYALSQTIRALRESSDSTELLVTYLNPNLGFRGESMSASNWTLLGRDWSSTRLSYIGERYITERELERQFGTANPQALCQLAEGFRVSTPLEPLQVWGFPISRLMRNHFKNQPLQVINFGLSH